MIPVSETPSGTAASTEWSTTCCVWWAAGLSCAACGIFPPWVERWACKWIEQWIHSLVNWSLFRLCQAKQLAQLMLSHSSSTGRRGRCAVCQSCQVSHRQARRTRGPPVVRYTFLSSFCALIVHTMNTNIVSLDFGEGLGLQKVKSFYLTHLAV